MTGSTIVGWTLATASVTREVIACFPDEGVGPLRNQGFQANPDALLRPMLAAYQGPPSICTSTS
jgi:hypothetical protein